MTAIWSTAGSAIGVLFQIVRQKATSGSSLVFQGPKREQSPIAICWICRVDIPFKNNTTNLFSHLEWHHKDVHAKARWYSATSSKQPTLQESLTALQPLSTPSARHKQLVAAIGNFIAKDMRLITVAEGEGFCEYLQVADPHFKLPSRCHFAQAVLPAK